MTDKTKELSDKQASTFAHSAHWDSVFTTEFTKESDRAAVVLTGSIFDNSLHDLLKNYLVSNPSSTDDLFDDANAPLSTFSSKILISHRLGLISANLCRDLHLIRKIRNEFAHNIHGCSFDDSRVKSRVLELYKSASDQKKKQYRSRFPNGSRGDFMFSCSLILWALTYYTEHCVKIPEAELEFGYKTIAE